MIYLEDVIMFLQYIAKTIRLELLRQCFDLDFTGRVESKDERMRGYEGCYSVKHVLKTIDITRKDSILDIGCGKGLFLYYARQFPFNRIDGIEYSPELIQVAKANAQKFSDGRIHIFQDDARDFEKYSNYNYFFFNNPFGSEVMEEVIKKILHCFKGQGKRITVIYQFPYNIEIFRQYGFRIVYKKNPNIILIYDRNYDKK